MSGKDWGRICITTRLEKQVEAEFFASWTGLLMRGKRKGDVIRFTRGKVAHVAQNENVRAFLLETDCDTFLSLDSDADFEPHFLNEFRDYAPGWQFDAFQAFHLRRGYPLTPIWLVQNPLIVGALESQIVLGQGESELGLVGTHCALIRREVFTAIYATYGESHGIPLAEFEWFTYPRHREMSDEAQFSHEARSLGFRLGGTTEIRIDHIARQSIGWPEYQKHLTDTHARERGEYYQELAGLIAAFTGETVQQVMAKALQGNVNVKTAWERANPQTPEELRAFYGDKDNGYLYDLLSWNWSESYWRIAVPLKEYRKKSALVIGAGLGTEVEWLFPGNDVNLFEIDGVLKEFIGKRFDIGTSGLTARCEQGRRIGFIFDSTLQEHTWVGYGHQYDLIVCIDVLEHIHPAEIQESLDAIFALLAPGGIFYCHNNWGNIDLYPMHFDHSVIFEQWLQENQLERVGAYEYRRPLLEKEKANVSFVEMSV